MGTGAKIGIAVAALAVVGFGVYVVVLRPKAIGASTKKATTTTDKVVGAVTTLIPFGIKVAEMWMDDDDDDE